jgi:hypothetical protein
LAAMVLLMTTSNKTTFAVAFAIPRIQSVKRSAELITQADGYSIIRYSGDRELVELTSETEADLLNLVPPFQQYSTKNKSKSGLTLAEGVKSWNLPDISNKKLLRFLNKWGSVGFQDQIYFRKLATRKPGLLMASPLGDQLGVKGLDLFIGENLGLRFHQRGGLDEIPLPWVEEELRTIATMLRITLNLLRDNRSRGALSRGEISLNNENRKRIISSHPAFAVFAFNDNQDPAKEFFKAKEWELKVRKVPVLERAEDVIDIFARNLNRYLRPLTQEVIRTNDYEESHLQKIGFENAFSSMLLETLKTSIGSLICRECQAPFFPKRVQNDRKYCGETCSRRARQREARIRRKQQNSALNLHHK